MANSDKNIRITTSRNKATFPNIVFTGSAAGSSVITLNILDDNSMSFESNEGQVFSLDSNLSTGTIWGVSDISGIPLLRASAGATIGLAEYSGFVGIGTNIPTYKLHVRGLAAFASTNDQTLSFIFDTSLAAGSANLQVRRGNTIRFYASGDTLYTAIKAATTNTYTLTLPPAVPSAGSTFLTSDTSGNLAWAAPPATGTATTAQNINIATASSGTLYPLFSNTSSTSTGIGASIDTGFFVDATNNVFFANGLALVGSAVTTTSSSFNFINTNATTINEYQVGTAISIGAATGTLTVNNATLKANQTTSSTSTSTGAIVNNGGLGMASNAFIGGTVNITSTTASGSTISGALVVTGGGAIGQSLSLGGFLQLFNGSNYSSFRYTGSATTIYTLPANSPQSASGTSVLTSTIDGTMSWVGMGGGGSGVVNSGTAGSVAFYAADGTTISGSSDIYISSGNGITVNATTNSTSTTTGALVVRGGAGIAGTINVGQRLTVGSSLNSTSTTTGALVNSGGLGLAGNAFIGGTITLSDTTNSTSSTTGAMVISGGVGVGGTINVGQRLTVSSSLNSTSTTTGALVNSGGLGLAGNAFIGGTVTLSDTTNSTSSSTGAMVISGGVGVGGTINIGQRLTVGSSLNSTSTTTGALVNSGGLGLAGNAFIGGTVNITSNTASGSTISGALVVTGGGAIGQSLSVGGFLQLFNGANYSSFRYTGSATTIYTLPANSPQSASGTSVLSSTIDGTMSWVGMSGGSASPGGSNTQIQFNNSGAFGGATGFTYESTNNIVTVSSNALSGISAVMLRLKQEGQGGSAQPNRYSPAVEMIGRVWTGVAANENHHRYKFEVIPNNGSQTSDLSFKASIDTGTASYYTGNILKLSVSNGVGIGATDALFTNYLKTSSSQAADKTYTLPLDYPGTGTSVLQSNTTGTLTWVPMTSGGSGVVNSGTAGSVAFYAADGTTISGSSDIYISSGNGITINATTGSGSTTTGALVVKGGVGIGGTVNLWAAINAWGNSEFRAYNASNFYVSHDASTSLGVNSSYKWPTYPSGTASSFLSSDTSGNLVWLAPSGGTATKRFHLLTLAAGYTPATGTTADDAVYRIPYSPADGSTQLTWNVREAFLRTETTAAGISTVQIEYNTGTGVFDPPTGVVLTGIGLSVGGAGVAETFHRTFNQSTLTSGTKVRLRFGTINSSHSDLLITLLLEEQ